MARATLILAKNISEANAYAKLAGLQRFTYRAVRSAGAIRGVRNAEVHILPSFLRRVDRHAILATLAWAKTLEVYYVDPADLEEETRGDLTDRQLEVAYRYDALRDAALRAAADDAEHGPASGRPQDFETPDDQERSESPIGSVEAAENEGLAPEKPAPKPRKPRAKAKAATADDFFA